MKRLAFFLCLLWLLGFQMASAQTHSHDVNHDGEVNIADINAVIHAILSGIEDSSYDVNRDGEVNIGDINNLVDRILGNEHQDDHLVFNVGNASFKMIRVDGGTFMMGNNSGKSNEKPVHEVTLSPYYIGETEVTQALWRAAGCINRSYYKNSKLPLHDVMWLECQEFIRRLNVLTGYRFSLPTEAQWEFAARGGNRSMPYSYSGSRYIEEVAWYRSNADNHHGGVSGPQTVALLLPNELGLYDMSGNVWEYCQDWYGPYSDEPQTDPKGPSTGTARVMRGGSFIESSNSCKCAKRDYTQWYDEGANTIGFRLAM